MGAMAVCSSSRNRRNSSFDLSEDVASTPVSPDFKRRPGLKRKPTHRKLVSTLGYAEDPNKYEGDDRERVIIVRELVNSEKLYLHGLQRIFMDFVDPLEESEILPQNSMLRRFLAPIEMMVEHHTVFYFDMHQSTNVANVFLETENMNFLNQYSMFIDHYDDIVQKIKDLRMDNSKVDAFFKEKEHDIEFYLLYPIQRIPRYRMLIDRILKYTNESHQDYQTLQKAANSIKAVCDKLNETKRRTEAFSELKGLRQRIKKFDEPLWAPNRAFLVESKCKLTIPRIFLSGYRVKSGVFFVFSDMILVCNSSDEYERHIFFSYFRNISRYRLSSLYKFCLRVTMDYEEDLILIADSKSQAGEWYEILHKRQMLNGINSFIAGTSEYFDDSSPRS